jgi:outer membrane protein OmpA-like peptidoglycan-associated protein
VMDLNQQPVDGAFVNLFAEDESLIASFIVKKDGVYGFDVENDKNYKLTADKETFIPALEFASTAGSNAIVIVNLILLEETIIVVNTDLAPIAKMNNIYFDYDKSDIRPDAAKELDKIVVIMNKYPTMHVEIASHADCRGDASYNLDLSHRRANSSNEYVKARITNPDRISGKGYGETRLVNDCPCKGDEVSDCSPEQQQKNRRTEFIVLKK